MMMSRPHVRPHARGRGIEPGRGATRKWSAEGTTLRTTELPGEAPLDFEVLFGVADRAPPPTPFGTPIRTGDLTVDDPSIYSPV